MEKRSASESYVIRICRRDRKNRKIISGIVEGVGEQGKVAFLGADSLWNILSSAGGATPREEQTQTRGTARENFESFAEIMESIREELEDEPVDVQERFLQAIEDSS